MKTLLYLLAIISWLGATAQNKVGINTNSPLETLDVNGNTNFRGLLKINGSAGTANQVLMSKGAGADPIWANSAFTGGGKFWASINNNSRSTGGFQGRGENWDLAAGTTQEDSIDFGVVNLFGTDITISNPGLQNNYILINKSGLYHFEGTVRAFTTCDDVVTMTPRSYIRFRANRSVGSDFDFYLIEDLMEKTGSPATGASTNQFNYLAKFKIDIYLEANTTLAFIAGLNQLKVSPPLLALGYSTGGYISGHFISD